MGYFAKAAYEMNDNDDVIYLNDNASGIDFYYF